jgi:hypothetical protein
MFNEIMCSKDHALNTRKRLSIRNNKLVGAVLFGDSTDGLFYFDLIKKATDITDILATDSQPPHPVAQPVSACIASKVLQPLATEVMIRITTPRVFFDACPTDKLKSMRLKLKQGEIKWK